MHKYITITGSYISIELSLWFLVMVLWTLTKAQDNEIPRLHDMNAFLGEPFTMTCPEGEPSFHW